MARLRDRGHARARRRLRRVFARAEASLGQHLPIRKTVVGIWVPTPLDLAVDAIAALIDLGVLSPTGPARPSVDAGMGDGRVLCVAALLDPKRPLYGIEHDPQLFARASDNVRTLEARGLIAPDRIRLIHGDFGDRTTYERSGLRLAELGAFFNYPDGSQVPLAELIAAEGGLDTCLCLITHNRSIGLDRLALDAQRDIPDRPGGTDVAWRLSVYRPLGEAPGPADIGSIQSLERRPRKTVTRGTRRSASP